MTTTQSHLDSLADRIERAYHRQHPRWDATGLTQGVWSAAAVRLNEVAKSGPGFPIDPELFVAVQNYKSFRRDPWCELCQEGAAKRYRLALRKIINQLKAELNSELRWSQRALDSGRSLDEIMAGSKARVSPIAKLVLCHHQRRTDLVELVRPSAEAQHLACPLYRFACRNLIPSPIYPDPQVESTTAVRSVGQTLSFIWN